MPLHPYAPTPLRTYHHKPLLHYSHNILDLLNKYHKQNTKDKQIFAQIQKAIQSSPDMQDKYELIMKFINTINPKADNIANLWYDFVSQEKKHELSEIITSERLKKEATEDFMNYSFKEGYITNIGLEFTNMLPPINMFAVGDNSREAVKD